MGVSLEQWRAAIGSFSASIKACNLPHCSVALCHVDTLFSVLWFVATISLQSMKTALMLLILLSGDVERNPGPDVMKCTPGLPELLNFNAKSRKINIACEMSTSWRSVGIALLNDTSGATVSALHQSNFHVVGDTSIAILTKWVQGSGIDDRSWQGLLGVLDDNCQALATEIRDTLSSRQPLKEGFVNLRVPGWLWGHNWKKKWMILRKDQLLRFQDSSTKADSNVEETQYVQDATDAYNVPADWRIWPETALKGKCCFIVNVSEAAKPYFVVARDEAEKREWMEGIQSFQEGPAVAIDDHVVKDSAVGACGGDVRKKVTPGEPGGRGKTYEIFLSYKHETISMKCAQTVCKHLTGLGYKVYLDERELMGGVNIGKELTAAISEAPIFLPILSSQYMTKDGELWCQRELDFAKYKERELLPVVIKGVEIPDDVMLTIGPSTMRLEYDPFDPSTGIASIARAVGRLLAKQPASHVSPVGKGALSDVQENEGPVLAASVPHSDSMPSISKSLEIVACPSPSLQEEGRKKTCQPVVLAYWYWITKCVKPEALLPYVLKYNLLEPQHHAEITKLTTSGQRTNAIVVNGILYKGEKELEEFIASLEEEPDHSEHQTLVRMLKEGLSGKPAPLPSESSAPTVQRIIYPHMPAIIRWMDSKELETHLVQHGLVTDYDIEYLHNPNQTQTDRNYFVISLLWSCGDKAVEIFIRCLIKATTHRAHKELASLLIQQLRQENYEELAEALEHEILSADSPAKACSGSPSGEKDLTELSADSPPPDIISGPSGNVPDTVGHYASAQPDTKHTVFYKENVFRPKIMPAHDFSENLVDPIEVILCDEVGGIYHNLLHGISLSIPEGAIPVGLKLEISIGVLLHGNFDFPSGLSPVSAIVWLCTPQPNFTFLKPVEVIIPHFMDCKSDDDAARFQMQFMKASHWSPDKANLQFDCADGEQDFGTVAYKGVLHTHHFCYVCVTSPELGVTFEYLQRRRFCISCAKPYSQPTEVSIFFYITYLLDTCLREMEKKLPERYRIAVSRSFKFRNRSRPGISIAYESSNSQLQATLQPTKISQEQVNFWQLHLDGDLKVMEERGLYPPRMELEITEIPSIPVTITITFGGTLESKEETMMQIALPYSEATSSSQSDSHPAEVATPVLTDSPSISQLYLLRGSDQKDSISLINELTPEWERFGYTLDFDRWGSHIAFIKKEHAREGAVACCNHVLTDWLKGQGAYQPPTWANLISILEDIDECRFLAQSLRTYFSK